MAMWAVNHIAAMFMCLVVHMIDLFLIVIVMCVTEGSRGMRLRWAMFWSIMINLGSSRSASIVGRLRRARECGVPRGIPRAVSVKARANIVLTIIRTACIWSIRIRHCFR